MFTTLPRRLCQGLLALLLPTALPAQPQSPCAEGEQAFCLVGSCLCMAGAPGDAGTLYQRVQQLSAQALQIWIEQSRDQLLASGVEPIPLHIRSQLEPFFDLAVLETVRYRVGDETVLNAANTLLHNPDVNALTLIEVIVFRNAADAQDNAALWAHELKHVEQYLEWGVGEFARRYSLDPGAVERPAYALEREVEQALRRP